MIYRVQEDFKILDINPFTNKDYDSSWIAYFLTNSKEYELINGGNSKSLYTLKVSKKYSEWKMSLIIIITLMK